MKIEGVLLLSAVWCNSNAYEPPVPMCTVVLWLSHYKQTDRAWPVDVGFSSSSTMWTQMVAAAAVPDTRPCMSNVSVFAVQTDIAACIAG